MTFDGHDLYETPIAKASAIIESVVVNHPFLDGNKRTGYTLGHLILLENHIDMTAKPDSRYDFVINVASGKYQYEDNLKWLTDNTAAIA